MNNMSQPVVTAELEQLARIYRGRVILVDSSYRICKDTFDATNKLFDDYYASKEEQTEIQ